MGFAVSLLFNFSPIKIIFCFFSFSHSVTYLWSYRGTNFNFLVNTPLCIVERTEEENIVPGLHGLTCLSHFFFCFSNFFLLIIFFSISFFFLRKNVFYVFQLVGKKEKKINEIVTLVGSNLSREVASCCRFVTDVQ